MTGAFSLTARCTKGLITMLFALSNIRRSPLVTVSRIFHQLYLTIGLMRLTYQHFRQMTILTSLTAETICGLSLCWTWDRQVD